jgi:predicted lipoprotein with Yx(FWY)xxD motif
MNRTSILQHHSGPRYAYRAVLAATVLFVLSACGDDDESTATTVTTAPITTTPMTTTAEVVAPTTVPITTEAPGADAAPTVALATTSLGDILVDASGFTLYGFTPDSGGVSTCYDDCAANWPPTIIESADAITVGDGLDASIFTTVERDDGTLQVAADGRPLYSFSGDRDPGDVNGQGVGDVWYVVTAEGALLMPDGEVGVTTTADLDGLYGQNNGGYDRG